MIIQHKVFSAENFVCTVDFVSIAGSVVLVDATVPHLFVTCRWSWSPRHVDMPGKHQLVLLAGFHLQKFSLVKKVIFSKKFYKFLATAETYCTVIHF